MLILFFRFRFRFILFSFCNNLILFFFAVTHPDYQNDTLSMDLGNDLHEVQ